MGLFEAKLVSKLGLTNLPKGSNITIVPWFEVSLINPLSLPFPILCKQHVFTMPEIKKRELKYDQKYTVVNFFKTAQ
jgi:hypothetical protein